MRRDILVILLLFALLAVAGLLMPAWLRAQFGVGLAKGLAVLGLAVLWRAGLVSFGHALYLGLGGYAAALAAPRLGAAEALLLIPLGGLLSGLLAAVLGLLLRRYRGIFFAMLNLAFSMILFGIVAKSAALGSTDGLSVPTPRIAGTADGPGRELTWLLLCAIGAAAAIFVAWWNASVLGRLAHALRDNPVRVEYLGVSPHAAVHAHYVLSGALAGAGGAAVALMLGQVDPESMLNWTASGELVFVTVLAGAGHVLGPFLAAILFELLKGQANLLAPEAWQLVVGAALLALIMFMPGGITGRLRSRNRDGEG